MRGYSFLKIAGEANRAESNIISNCLEKEKIIAQIKRSFKRIKAEENPKVDVRLISGRSMMGSYRFKTFEKIAETIYYVTDEYSSARFYLSELVDFLRKNRQSFTYIPSPDADNICEGVYIKNTSTAYLTMPRGNTDDIPYKKINMKRFLDSDMLSLVKQDLRMLENEKRKFCHQRRI